MLQYLRVYRRGYKTIILVRYTRAVYRVENVSAAMQRPDTRTTQKEKSSTVSVISPARRSRTRTRTCTLPLPRGPRRPGCVSRQSAPAALTAAARITYARVTLGFRCCRL